MKRATATACETPTQTSLPHFKNDTKKDISCRSRTATSLLDSRQDINLRPWQDSDNLWSINARQTIYLPTTQREAGDCVEHQVASPQLLYIVAKDSAIDVARQPRTTTRRERGCGTPLHRLFSAAAVRGPQTLPTELPHRPPNGDATPTKGCGVHRCHCAGTELRQGWACHWHWDLQCTLLALWNSALCRAARPWDLQCALLGPPTR